ncbi:lysozyme [Candidatus Parcubacteria bacterium]|nr:MAG: lysozyme [Candidatus Parcubacteria bacterium]
MSTGKILLILFGAGLIAYAILGTGFARAIIKRFEGFSATPFKDADGYSIGYGHFIVPGDPYWPEGNVMSITEAEAETLLTNDMNKARAAVLSYTRVPLSAKQLDALTSLVYNIGINAFANSTLLKKLNAGDFSGAAAEFMRWINVGGSANAGLASRRAEEYQIFVAA